MRYIASMEGTSYPDGTKAPEISDGTRRDKARNREFTCSIGHQQKKKKKDFSLYPGTYKTLMSSKGKGGISAENHTDNLINASAKSEIGKTNCENTARNPKPGRGEIKKLTSELIPRLGQPQTHEPRGKAEVRSEVK